MELSKIGEDLNQTRLAAVAATAGFLLLSLSFLLGYLTAHETKRAPILIEMCGEDARTDGL